MFFETVKTPGIATVSYILGHQGQALVMDPRRDVDVYFDLCRDHDLALRYALVTHRQEDFLLGTATLREAGVEVVAGDDSRFGPCDIALRDGQVLELGGLRIRALHTPGHTDESMSYAVFHPDAPDTAWGVFTGDALFVGGTGRVDLAGEAAENAARLYDSVHDKLWPLGAQALVFPAHGAGSVCGNDFAEYDRSSLGFEREHNPVFQLDREGFIEAKVTEELPRPPYFEHVHAMNERGVADRVVAANRVPVLGPRAFSRRVSQTRGAMVIDTRAPEAFAAGHIPGALSVWLGGLSTVGGWVVEPDRPVFLVVAEPGQVEAAVLHLSRIGVGQVRGLLSDGFDGWRNAGQPVASEATLSVHELAAHLDDYAVLDVRETSEFGGGHIQGARHLYVGELPATELELERDQPIAVTCSVGNRASLATSMLAARGYTNVHNVIGGMKAWKASGRPVVG